MLPTCSVVILEDTGKVSDGVGTLSFLAHTYRYHSVLIIMIIIIRIVTLITP